MIVHLSALLLLAITYATFVVAVALVWRPLKLSGPATQPLDVLRGLAATFVMVSHLVRTYAAFELGSPFKYEPNMYYVVELGTVGVCAFFLVTGYLFCGPAYPASKAEAPVSRTFLIKRWRRLAPAFLMTSSLIFGFHVAYLVWNDLDRDAVSLLEAFVRIFSFGAFLGEVWEDNRFLMHAAGMSWSLAYEWVFYALVAAAVASNRRWLLPIAVTVWFFGASLWAEEVNRWPALFLVGWLYHKVPNLLLRNLLVLLAGYGLSGNSGLLASALFLFFCQLRSWPAWLQPFATAGHVTYSFYLVHGLCQLLAYVGVRNWLSPSGLGSVDLYLFGVIAAVLSALCAASMYRYFEMPYFVANHAAKRGPNERLSVASHRAG